MLKYLYQATKTSYKFRLGFASSNGICKKGLGEMVKGTVLVVDDTNINRVMIKSILSDICYVIQASGGNEALNILLKMDKPPDLILLDLIMSGISGFEFMELIQGVPSISDIPVMVVTSMLDKHYQNRAISLGAVDFVTRPFNADVFKTRVKNNIELAKYRNIIKSEEPGESGEASEAGSDACNKELNHSDERLLEIMAGVSENAKTGDVLSGTGLRIERLRIRAEILVSNMLKNNKYRDALLKNNCESLIKAMPINDIGKIGIPESILLKPGKLTADEFEFVKRHTLIGADIIKRMMKKCGENDYMKNCHDICRFHHERWDGRGYPDGLAAEEIPLPARINALLDVYDALTRDKPYKKANTHHDAIDIIAAGKATQFDPYLIDCFMEIEGKFHDK